MGDEDLHELVFQVRRRARTVEAHAVRPGDQSHRASKVEIS